MSIALNEMETEFIRQQLLADEEVRAMISMRAFEIFRSRGSEPGHEAEDWFQAEKEILVVLINEEVRKLSDAQRAADASATRSSKGDGAFPSSEAPGQPAATEAGNVSRTAKAKSTGASDRERKKARSQDEAKEKSSLSSGASGKSAAQSKSISVGKTGKKPAKAQLAKSGEIAGAGDNSPRMVQSEPAAKKPREGAEKGKKTKAVGPRGKAAK